MPHPCEAWAAPSHGHLKLGAGHTESWPWERPFASARSVFTSYGSRWVLETPSCGSTHQERHLRAVRPVRRSGVTRLAALGELPFLGSPAFPLHLSTLGARRRRIVVDAVDRAGRYAGGGKTWLNIQPCTVRHALKSSSLPDINPWKLILYKKLKPQVLKENNDELQPGYLGSEKTHARISEYYYWPGLYSELIKYMKYCKFCQRTKSNKQAKIELMWKRLIEEPWTMEAADVMRPLPLIKEGNNQYILVFVDFFTKWVEIIPIEKANGKTIESEFHKRIRSRWGTRRVLHTDNSTEFVN